MSYKKRKHIMCDYFFDDTTNKAVMMCTRPEWFKYRYQIREFVYGGKTIKERNYKTKDAANKALKKIIKK